MSAHRTRSSTSRSLEKMKIMTAELAVDSRGRTSLAKVRKKAFDHYSVKEEDDGTLILTPVSAVEAAILKDPAVMAAIEAARERGGNRSQLRPRKPRA